MPVDPPSDEALVARVGAGDEAALRALYARHAGLVFSIAARVAPAEAAEDVVQEVFLALWRKSETFDPQKGTFKSWLGRIAKNRALNERRRRAASAGAAAPDPEAALAEVADDAPPPDEARWIAHRQKVLHDAVDALPEAQRRAVSLAFFDELPQSEVASVLGAPLGTVKTRIRLSMKRLAPILATALLAIAAVLAGWRWRRDEARRAREERALRMVTASDVAPIRLHAVNGAPDTAHGTYRARRGEGVAVLTTTALPPLGGGERYVGWAREGSAWISFGVIDAAADGRSLSVAEDAALAAPPDELRVTRETRETSAPEGPAVVAWP
jgi:RNA polymerase sigma-70 factor (ECF subfamily)